MIDMGKTPKKHREKIGHVVSDKMDKTVVVRVNRFVQHPLYGKVVRRVTTLKAHDEQNACKQGDRVKVRETRPISKQKRWRVIDIVQRAQPD